MNHPAVRWSVWLVVTILWTIGLIVPLTALDRMPVIEDLGDWRVIIAKTVHVCIYAFWTYLTGWLRTPLRFRIFLLMFLMAHAVGTEWRQMYVPARSGTLRDAALDHLGIFLGVLLSLRWWTAPDAVSEPNA